MNTLLHILEGYTNLIRIWEDPLLRERLTDWSIFLLSVVDPETHFTRLFFEMDWNPLGDRYSFNTISNAPGCWLRPRKC